jgi:autotransporter-associated beta strand protein
MRKFTFNPVVSLISASLFLAAQAAVGAGVTTWSGAGGANQNWSAAANWTTVGGSTPPGAGDSVIFRSLGAAGAAGTVNSIVDPGFTAPIAQLMISNDTATAFHTIQIPTGNTLTVSGPIIVGCTNNAITDTITGGGTLVGGTGTSAFTVASVGTSSAVTLDMSGLNNFIFNSGGAGGTFNVGLDPGNNSGAVLKLAAVSNNITATTMNIGNNNNGGSSTMNLGAGTNIINANTIEIADSKVSGTLTFNGNTGGLRLRNAAGTGRTTLDMSGNPGHSGSASASDNSSILLNGHYVDMMIGTMTMANKVNRSGGGTANAVFSFNSGIVDVTTINMSTNITSGTVGSAANSTLSVGGGTLKVFTNISLMSAGGAPSVSALIITNGALVTCGGSIFKTTSAGTSTVSITNSTVTMTSLAGTIGTSGQAIDTLNLNNATLHFNLDNFNQQTAIVATTINTNGLNVITIDSVANASGTITFPLISYSGTDPFGSLKLNLPLGYTGNLIDGAGLIQVTLTAPTTVPLTWVGNVNSLWDTNKTKNWTDFTTSQAYGNPDPVTFDDNAVNSLVTVVTTNTPQSININNYNLNYVFNGAGKISGTVGINKQGNGSLMLADNGDDFSGGIAINGGTLILDNTNSAISGGLTISWGNTVQIGNNDNYGALPAGPVQDDGTLVFQRANNITLSTDITGAGMLVQNGSGKLTINTTNQYTGSTVVSKGTLALVGGGSVSNSPGLLVSNATFDVSGVAGTTLLNDFSIANASLTLATASLLTPLAVTSFEVDGIHTSSNIINLTTLPGVANYPATITLVKSINPITLTGGNFNFVLGSLPAASPAYVGSLALSGDGTSILLTLTSGPTGQRSFVTWAGIDNTTATTNWSDGLNWQLPGAPGVSDSVVFDSGGTTVPNNTTVNNFVDNNFSVATLTYNQTASGQWHVTQIPAGTTLTVNGNTTIGGQTGDGLRTSAAMVDAGTLVLKNNLSIGNNGSTGGDTGTILDLSGLSNFVFNAASGTITMGTGNRSAANFNLASGSNNITAGTINANTASSSTSTSGTLSLGVGTNILNVDIINIAAQRSSCTVNFPSGSTTGGLRLRGAAGTDASRTTMVVGNRTASGSSGTTTGTLNLAGGHPVDAKLSALTVGECTATSPNVGTGVMEFDTGTIDTTSLLMAVDSNSGTVNGTVTVDTGATLIVGTGGISLVNQTSTGTATGTLNINGGTLICSNSIVKSTSSGSTANITLTGGTVNMISGTIGTMASKIDNLTLNGGTTVQLNVVPGVTNIVANSVNPNGSTTINIKSFAGLVGTMTVPIFYYGFGGDPIYQLTLGSVPAGYTIGNGGQLVDDTANQTISVVVTPPAPIIWKGNISSSWDTSTLNWLNGSTSSLYSDASYVQFDDTASTFTVNVASTVSPSGFTVNNTAHNYTINGSGSIGGFSSLTKQGSGTLILDNSGTNTFSGGVNLTAGTLQIGNNDANGNIPVSGNITDNGNLAFDQTDSNTVANAISGSGNVSQIGTGTNKLTGANTYTGNTVISSGMLIVSSAAAGDSALGLTTGAGSVTITNGGTLDIENPTANVMSFTNTTDSAGKQFYIAGSGVGGNGAIVNNGTVNQQNAIQNLTLTADATFGGPARWDLRVPDGRFQPILDLQGHTLTKTGSNQMSMVALIVTNGGNIVINQGTLSFETISSNNATHITVNAGGVLGHFRENATLFTAPITLNGGMIRDLNGTPGSTNDSPITLTANSFLDLNVGSVDQIRLNGNIAESGGSFGLTKTNVGTYSLAGINTYSGPTMIVQGTLILANNGSIAQSSLINVAAGTTFDASQRFDQTLTLGANQTLSGFGTVTGLVSTVSGSTVAPGSSTSTGVLTFDNNVTLSGATTIKVTHATIATNDVLNVASTGTLTVGGALNISLLGGGFVAGDSFKLFNAPGGYSGTFSATNLPALGGGLAWDTTNLVSGVLAIVSGGVNTNPTNITATVSSGTLHLSWPADHTGWRLLVQTNAISGGLNPNPGAWVEVPGSSSVNSVSIPMDPTKGTVFYRMVYP